MPDHPPRQDDREKTIDEENEVDEASFESFPASDPPGWSATYTEETDESDESDEDEDDKGPADEDDEAS